MAAVAQEFQSFSPLKFQNQLVPFATHSQPWFVRAQVAAQTRAGCA